MVLLAVALALVGPAAAAVQMQAYAVDGVVCLNGGTPYVFANSTPGVTDWVLNLGGSNVDLNFCISEKYCTMYANLTASTTPPGPLTGPESGPQSDNCDYNPTFCKFNQAVIGEGCDFSLFLGDADVTKDGVTMHFQGRKLLTAALKKLASLGMSTAERVLLTGVGHQGTAVVLNADFIGTQLKSLLPSLKDYRALPADGVHPKFGSVIFFGNDVFTSYLGANFNLSGAVDTISTECKARHPSDPWMCLYVNETLPSVKTPIFLVNQLASIWDTQCDLAGMDANNILQLQCIPNTRTTNLWHICFQYVERCRGDQVTNTIIPFQQQYITDTLNSGIMSKPGNGGFYHSCHLGAYFNTGYQKPGAAKAQGQWQNIDIGGVTMQQAVTNWWTGSASAPSVFTKDCLWNVTQPGYFCNPSCRNMPPYMGDEAMVVV